MISYATIGTNDVARAEAFYGPLLATQGVTKLFDHPNGGVVFGKDGRLVLGNYDVAHPAFFAGLLDDVRIFRSDRRRPFQVPGASDGVYQGMHRSHWWLVAKVR